MSASPVIQSVADFYNHLAVSDACRLEKRLYKKQFYEYGQLNATDKKAFVEDIAHIEWRYTLKPATINIPRFEDEHREYLEIAILQVTLNQGKRHKRIADIMQKAVPYPLLIVMAWAHDGGESLALNAADKRINRADSNKIVVETVYDTGWLNLARLAPWQQAFLADFQLTQFPFSNILAFYQAITQRIVALNCAQHTGRYAVAAATNGGSTNRLAALRQLDQLQQERGELRNKLSKEKNLGTQVQLNTRVKQLSDRIEATKQTL